MQKNLRNMSMKVYLQFFSTRGYFVPTEYFKNKGIITFTNENTNKHVKI